MTYRKKLIEVALPLEAITPPDGEGIIRDKLANLDHYMHDTRDGVDPLIKLAVIHYQFEAIHPFTDGNGRTGRIINILYLVERALLDLPLLYMSRSIIDRKNEYYAGLREVTERQAWEDWILYMLDVVADTSRATIQQIQVIRRLMEDYRARVRKRIPKVYSHELVDLLFERPYCKVSFLVHRDIAQRQTASQYLKSLVKEGLLRSMRIGREAYYINTEFLEMLAGGKGPG